MRSERFRTHEVENQPPPFEDIGLFGSGAALCEGLEREGAGWASARAAAGLETAPLHERALGQAR